MLKLKLVKKSFLLFLTLLVCACNSRSDKLVNTNSLASNDTLVYVGEYMRALRNLDSYFYKTAVKNGYLSVKEYIQHFKFGEVEEEKGLTGIFEFDSRGNIIRLQASTFQDRYIYNSSNKLIEKKRTCGFVNEGAFDCKDFLVKYAYSYNQNGNLISELKYEKIYEKLVLQHKWIGVYDKEGKLIKQTRYDQDGEKDIIQSNSDLDEDTSQYERSGEAKFKITFDSQNRIQSETSYINFPEISDRTLYEYDTNSGILKSKVNYDKDGDPEYIITYEYGEPEYIIGYE